MKEEIIDEKYAILEKLGQGAYSTVYKVLNKETNELFAIKVIEGHFFNNEFKINNKLRSLNYPYIVKFFKYSQWEDGSDLKPYFVFELSDKGELNNYINSGKDGFSEKFCKMIFYEIIKAIQILHNEGICHRDIKAENILLNGDNYEIKICDLGFSTETDDMLEGEFGTKQYIAPEIIMKKEYDGKKADIFSLGVLLFYLRTTRFLFEQAKIYEVNKPKTVYDYIKEKSEKVWEISELNEIGKLSDEFKELFLKMVAFNPKERPNIDEILKDKWFNEINNLTDDERQKLKDKLIKEFQQREEDIKP